MSITNFTPGPWCLSPNRTYIRRTLHGFNICEPNADLGPQESKANAALLVSAPDLYAALDAFLDAYEETGEVDFAIRQKARAALNRAEGRAP